MTSAHGTIWKQESVLHTRQQQTPCTDRNFRDFSSANASEWLGKTPGRYRTQEPDKEAIRRQIDSGAADSVLGDREAAVGTYREIVIFDADQVYPEYRGRWAGIG